MFIIKFHIKVIVNLVNVIFGWIIANGEWHRWLPRRRNQC